MVPRLVAPGLKLSLLSSCLQKTNDWKVEAALEERGEGEFGRGETMLVETEYKEDFSYKEGRAGKE